MTPPSPHPLQRLLTNWVVWLLLLPWVSVGAAPTALQGQWTALPSDGPPQQVERIAATGGRFQYEAEFELQSAERRVIDFKNSSVLGRFSHEVFDANGALVAQAQGGIESPELNPFFLRHGRELELPAGRYRLVTTLESPFFLAQPEPYIDELSNYRIAIREGNALLLIGLGVFVGLGVYYTSLALIRRQRVHAMYAAFILGNFLYNGTALLAWHDLVDSGWFYLISLPILLSNMAYVVFVMDLLGLRQDSHPRLFAVGRALLLLLGAFAVLGVFKLNWSLELCRIGVGLFLVFGLTVGVIQAWRGQTLARLYLLANIGFFASGISAISLLDLQGVYTIYIEHIGLVAVTIEVLLLALVLSYQFGMLQREKEQALERAENNLRLACTDALTGLPNRYALEMELAQMPQRGSLTFIDLDGLKHYNDTHGHVSGDALLRTFAITFATRLGTVATLHRLGGDEFAATSREGDVAGIEQLLQETVEEIRADGYELSGASCGSVRVFECAQRDQLKHLADTRMYENKRRRKTRDRVASL
jgi:diguanylate cyclase